MSDSAIGDHPPSARPPSIGSSEALHPALLGGSGSFSTTPGSDKNSLRTVGSFKSPNSTQANTAKSTALEEATYADDILKEHVNRFLQIKDSQIELEFDYFNRCRASVTSTLIIAIFFTLYTIPYVSSFVIFYIIPNHTHVEKDHAVSGAILSLSQVASVWLLYLLQYLQQQSQLNNRFVNFLVTYIKSYQTLVVLITCACYWSRLIIRVHNGQCATNRIVLNWNCNPYADSEGLPVDTLVMIMALPLIMSLTAKAIHRNFIALTWFGTVISIIYCAVLLRAISAISVLFAYIITSILIVVDMKRQALTVFFMNKKLKEIIAENERIADEMHANEMRSMIANVAHDLKTPLASFQNGVDLIDQVVAEMKVHANHGVAVTIDEMDDYIQSITTCVQNIKITNSFMLMTINRCIDYTKASKGVKLVPKYETIDLLETLSLPLNCMKDIQSRVTIRLHDISDDICSHIITDRQWLQENVLCLLSNAVKYSSEGEVVVTVSLYKSGQEETTEHAVSSNHTTEGNNHVLDKMRVLFMNRSMSFTSNSSTTSNNTASSVSAIASSIVGGTGGTGNSSAKIYPTLMAPGNNHEGSGTSTPAMSVVETIHEEHSVSLHSDHGQRDNHSLTQQECKSNCVDVTGNESDCDRLGLRRSSSAAANNSNSSIADLEMGNNKDVGNDTQSNFPVSMNHLEGHSQPPEGSDAHNMQLEEERHTTPFLAGKINDHRRKKPGTIKAYLLIEVEDTGIGISEDAMESLFSPFKQAQRLAGGTGLGLYSLAKRVEALRGSCGVRGRNDGERGSLFWFIIPYRPDKISAALNRRAKRRANRAPVAGSSKARDPFPSATSRTHQSLQQPVGSSAKRRRFYNAGDLEMSDMEPGVASSQDETSSMDNNSVIDLSFSMSMSASRSFDMTAARLRLMGVTPSLNGNTDDEQQPRSRADSQQSSNSNHSSNGPGHGHSNYNPSIRLTTRGSFASNNDNSIDGNGAGIATMNSEDTASPGNIATPSISIPPPIGNVAPVFANLNILVVDDTPAIVKMSSMMLKRQGHKITTADNGMEALKKIEQQWQSNHHPFDVVLMDLQMPVMDGLEAAKRLREMEENAHFSRYAVASETNVGTGSGSGAATPTSRSAQNANNNSVTSQPINPPPMSPKARSFSNGRQIVIGVSANSDNDTVEEAFRAGFDAFLAKPFTIDSFYDTFGKVKSGLFTRSRKDIAMQWNSNHIAQLSLSAFLFVISIFNVSFKLVSGAATGLGILASQWRSIIHLLQSIHEQQEEEQVHQLQLQQKQREMRVLHKNSTVSSTTLQQSNVQVDHNNHTAGAMTYLQTLTARAVSRSMAQTLLHPAYTYKTLLQLRNVGQHIPKSTLATVQFSRLLKGIDAQFLLSLPHGAFHFFVIDQVKKNLGRIIHPKFEFLADFTSSALSTVICSIISTPQMVLTDRLMAGIYPSLPSAVSNIIANDVIRGFYRGWWPSLAQKIPSYGLTWMFFQQLKISYEKILKKKPGNEVNFILGALAAAASVTVMIPLDTIKTRLVVQTASSPMAYNGMIDCFVRIVREEGIGTFYKSLPPRLIAIQFGAYEALKSQFVRRNQLLRAQTQSNGVQILPVMPARSLFYVKK